MRAAMEQRPDAGASGIEKGRAFADEAPAWGASCVGERLVERSRLAAALHQRQVVRAEIEAYDAALPSNPPVRRASSESLL